MKRLILYGHYGFNNFGDDIFLQVADLIFTKDKYKAYVLVKNNIYLENIKVIKYKNALHKLFIMVYMLLRSRKVVIFGGSIINDYSLRTFGFLNLVSNSILAIKIYAIGLSKPILSPYQDHKYIKLMNRVKMFGYRDKDLVIDRSGNSKYLYSSDLAYYYFQRSKLKTKFIQRKDSMEYIAINLSFVNSFKHQEIYYKLITNLARKINSKYFDLRPNQDTFIKLFVLAENKIDYDSTLMFSNMLKTKNKDIIIYSANIETIVNEMLICDYGIGFRLHFSIVLNILNIPTIAFNYDEKITQVLDTHSTDHLFNNNEVLFNQLDSDIELQLRHLHESNDFKYKSINRAVNELMRELDV